MKICKYCFHVMKEEELKKHMMLHENKKYRKKLTSKKKLQMKICKYCFHVMKEKEIKNHMILHEDKTIFN